MFTLTRLLATGFFAFILWVIYLANTGKSAFFFDVIHSIPYGDKLGHFVLFGVLTLLINLALNLKQVRLLVPIYIGTLLVTVFVVAEEVSQAFIPTRTFDYGDLMADALGIGAFTLLTYLIGWVKARNRAEQPELN